MVVQTNQTTFYLDYVDAGGVTHLLTANNPVANNVEYFGSGSTFIGSDANGTVANDAFSGAISDVAVWNYDLTPGQILSLFDSAVGVAGNPPGITGQPGNSYTFAGNTAVFSATGITGTTPLVYQWQHAGTNLVNNLTFSGVNTNTLTVTNVTANVAGVYNLVITNLFGKVVSSNAFLVVPTPSLVGQWLNGTTNATNFVDLSGYSPAGLHTGYLINSNGNPGYMFTNDLPPAPNTNASSLSLLMFDGATALVISNSSTWDASYTNTYDDQIQNQFTVSCWAKNTPVGWSPFVSKWGEGPPYNPPEGGWQLRMDGDGMNSCFTVRDNNAGGFVFGNTGNAADDMATVTFPSNDGNWHHYAGTFNANTGLRCLYVDGQLVAQETNNAACVLAPYSHVVIGGKDAQPGNNFGNFATNVLYFDVRIYNYSLSQGQVQSLVGLHPPSIAGQPASVSAYVGTTATIAATGVSGSTPLSYQWSFNGTNISAGNTNYSGANTNILTILNATTNVVGAYQLTVTNLYGSVVSSNAFFTAVAKTLVGGWVNGTTSDLTDVSGYSPAGTHDGFAVGAANYVFTNDVPPYRTGQSLLFPNGDTAIAINNSATSDGATYTNTFDGGLANGFTVSFWAKGYNTAGGSVWKQYVSKDGYQNNGTVNDNLGWSVGTEGWSEVLNFSMQGSDHGGIAYPGNIGDGLWGNTILESPGYPGDTQWHFYTATYNLASGIRSTWYDGKVVAYQTGDGSYNQSPAEHLVLGAMQDSSGAYTSFLPTRLYDVRVYNYALNTNQILQLFAPPATTPAQIITMPPAYQTNYVGWTVQLSVPSNGGAPVTNQWQFNGVNLTDGGNISGSRTSVLTIQNVTTANAGLYGFTIANAYATASATVNLVIVPTSPAPTANLVGRWIAGSNTVADVSGYSPVGTHDGYFSGGVNHYWTNDVPPTAVPGSHALYVGAVGLVISNSSTLDTHYTNTFDNLLTNGFTLSFWAKGFPSGWSYLITKNGDSGSPNSGWTMRRQGYFGGNNAAWTMRSPGGTLVAGGDSYGSTDDMGSTNLNLNDGAWHFYTGAYTQGGNRTLYVDGNLVAQATSEGAYNLSAAEHFVIGGIDDSPGNAFGSYFTGEFYDVRIYDTELTPAQVGYVGTTQLAPIVVQSPTLTSGYHPGVNGAPGSFVLTWSAGTLQETTNLLSGWTPVTTVSPYTNTVSTTNKQMFFRVSNP